MNDIRYMTVKITFETQKIKVFIVYILLSILTKYQEC